MRGRRPALILALALVTTMAEAKRPPTPGFAEPGDIIAAEGYFDHLGAAKGIKAAIRATATPDAEVFAPQPLRVTDYLAGTASPDFPAQWHTGQLWMSCDGSVAVTHGDWQHGAATDWYVAIWQRQKGGGYKWVLEQGGTWHAPSPSSDMITASVADCPARRAHADALPVADRGKAPVSDYASGHSDDDTLEWSTSLAPDGGRSFALQVKRDGTLHEVLRTITGPAGS